MANDRKMSDLHYMKWARFREKKSNIMTKEEVRLLCELHSIYYKHSYWVPCTCSPKTYNTWIKQLNVIYNNGQ
jgi:hypothetical protein